MNKIPLPRIRLYLMILGLIPIFLTTFYVTTRLQAFNRMENELWDIKQKIVKKEVRLQPNQKVRKAHIGADHFWVDKELETFTPLKPEIREFEKLTEWGLLNPEDKKRFEFLIGKENRLLFTESALYRGEGIEEVVESSAHPIQVDALDLKSLLHALEGSADSLRPQTLVTDFKLQRKGLQGGDEVFVLDLKFVKREFTS